MSLDSDGQPRRGPTATLAPIWACVLANGAGAVLWVATTAISGRREAWDASLYWTVAYLLAIMVAGLLG